LTKTVALEVAETAITCNAICPGYFETDLNAPLLKDEAFVARVNTSTAERKF